MAGYDAREVANFFLDYAEELGVNITNMSLLKVIYYAHGWHLYNFKKPLVKNTFEAWTHGPVIRVVYDSFKDFVNKPIKSRATKFDANKNDYVVAIGHFEKPVSDFLKNIFDIYGTIDAFRLSEMTHESGGPWDIIMKKSKDEVCLQLKIPDTLIEHHFSRNKTWTT